MNRPTIALTLVLAIESVQFVVAATAGAQIPPRPSSPLLQRPFSRVFLDLNGDGLDLGGCSKSTGHRSPKAVSDDRVLAIDVAVAEKAGYRVVSADGTQEAILMIGSGLRITSPSGAIHEPVDGWSVVALLDSNHDGILGESDLCWPALRLAHDGNGDEVIQGGEIESLASRGIVTLGPRSLSATQRDVFGNEIADGAFSRLDRTVGRMADVSLARCDVPRDAGP